MDNIKASLALCFQLGSIYGEHLQGDQREREEWGWNVYPQAPSLGALLPGGHFSYVTNLSDLEQPPFYYFPSFCELTKAQLNGSSAGLWTGSHKAAVTCQWGLECPRCPDSHVWPWVKAEEDWAQLKFWDETSLTPQVVLEPRPLRVAPPQGLPTWSRQKSSWTWWLEGSPNCKSRGCQTFLRFKAWSWHGITSIIFYIVPLLKMARCVSSSCQRNVNVSGVSLLDGDI